MVVNEDGTETSSQSDGVEGGAGAPPGGAGDAGELETPPAGGGASRLRKGARLAAFGLGFVSVVWFFFGFVALVVGSAFLLGSKELAWKRNGFALSLAAGTSTVVAHHGAGLSPLFLAMASGWGGLGAFFLVVGAWELVKRARAGRERARPAGAGKPPATLRRDAKWRKAARVGLLAAGVVVPASLWASVSVDLGVLLDNETRLLWVRAPTTVAPGEQFPFVVQAWDAYERVSATYRGTVSFGLASFGLYDLAPVPAGQANATLPANYAFTGQSRGSAAAYLISDGKDNGQHQFFATIHDPGVHYLLVTDSATGRTYWSNPVVVDPAYASGAYRTYWGDIHGHTMLSDGSGWPDHHFLYARRVAGLDFAAITDHAEILAFNPWGLDSLEDTTNAANDPGQFVAFLGLEWTNVPTGHFTLVFDGDRVLRQPISSYFDVKTPDELWATLDEFRADTGTRTLAIPHHTTQNAYVHDWTYYNPDYVRLAEVSSVHGDFLFEPRDPRNLRGAIDPTPVPQNGTCVMDAFRMGYRLALYASSDQHDGHPGHSLSHTPAFVGHQRPFSTWHTRNEHPYPGGLVAARAANLTRSDVFKALWSGRVYASSDHGRPWVNFTLNGAPLGDGSTVVVSSADAPRTISVVLAQDGSPAGTRSTAARPPEGPAPDWRCVVEVFKNGELLSSTEVNSPVAIVVVVDDDPVTGARYREEEGTWRGGRFFINDYSDNAVDPDDLNTGGADFYVLRVVGDNGRHAWAGPFWVQSI
ncbi:MAG: hypothetical protein Kow0069_20000 [Promethearchaeota archaeon]